MREEQYYSVLNDRFFFTLDYLAFALNVYAFALWSDGLWARWLFTSS